MTSVALPLAIAGTSVIAEAVKKLYGIVIDLNDWIDKHIEEMKGSEKPTIARTGRVLEAAQFGFGIGYITSVIVIAAGQLLLGSPLAAVTTVATAAFLSNPIAMTCAAVGAIYYGWEALSDLERNEILEKLSKGLEVGGELVKSIVRFVMDKTKELLSSENLKEIKRFVGEAATAFGKTLGDVTHKVADMASDTFHVVRKKSGKAAQRASETYDSVKQIGGKVADGVKEKFKKRSTRKQ